jgi:PAS domain S-box-containing protein
MDDVGRVGTGSTSHSDELSLLVEAVQDYAIFLLSPTGHIRTWNRGAARIMGYTSEQILGEPFSRFYIEEDLANRKPDRELEVARAEGRVEDEGWRVRRDGRWFWANTVITALRDEEGELVGFAKVTRDLTERKIAEDRQRESEDLMRLLIDSVRDYAIFILDPEGNVATWNLGARRIKGYADDEIIGKHFSLFYPPEDVTAGKPEHALELAREHGSTEDEGWRVRKDGTRFWANVVITAVHDASGRLRGFAKITRDVTEKMLAEETRLAMLEQREKWMLAEDAKRRAEASYHAAQESNRAKDEFLMTLSHELRTPMTAILGWARLLPEMTPGDPIFAEAVASITRSASLQARLIDDILDISRIVAGKLHLADDIVPVQRLVHDAIDAVRAPAKEREIAITTDFGNGVDSIVGDSSRLHQILLNLLTNAVKFTPQGGRIEILARSADGNIEIAVRDNGEGIAPEFLERIFEPFRQAENPRIRVHGGLGLGLSIVRRLAEAHGGTVTAYSEGRGKGATFTLTLPVKPAAPRASAPREERQDDTSRPKPLAGVRILVVEDEPETQHYIATTLKMAGGEVVLCDSAAAALKAWDEARPDIVLTDIGMPGIDGYELTRELRAREGGESVKIVALSAFPASTLEDAAALDAYLTKPIDPHDLVAELTRIAARLRSEGTRDQAG